MTTIDTAVFAISRVAVFRDVRNDYSIGLAKAFNETFRRLGGTVVAELSYHQGDTDFSAQLTSFKQANIEAIYVPGYYGEVGNIARQAKRIGLNIPLLGGDGWDSPQLHVIGQRDIVGSYYTNDFSSENPTGKTRTFNEGYKKRYGQLPSGLAAQGYDAGGLLIDAIVRAKKPSPAAIRDALATTSGYAGVTGDITMDAQRNPIKPAVVLKVGLKRDSFEALVTP